MAASGFVLACLWRQKGTDRGDHGARAEAAALAVELRIVDQVQLLHDLGEDGSGGEDANLVLDDRQRRLVRKAG